jgi:hypothetical protein
MCRGRDKQGKRNKALEGRKKNIQNEIEITCSVDLSDEWRCRTNALQGCYNRLHGDTENLKTNSFIVVDIKGGLTKVKGKFLPKTGHEGPEGE